jgi:dihydrofolate reductase
MTVTIVAAVASNGVIGQAGRLPWRPPADMRHFKRLTLGHVVIMGRRTYESIGRPLSGRTTIVVSRRPTAVFAPTDSPGAELFTADSVEAAVARGLQLDVDVFIAGGAQVYADALDLADRMVLTCVDAQPAGDTKFPEVDWSQWRETQRQLSDGLSFVTYERV